MSDKKEFVETKVVFINVEHGHHRDALRISPGWELIETVSVPTIVSVTKSHRDPNNSYNVFQDTEPHIVNTPGLVVGRRENAALEAMQKQLEAAHGASLRYQKEQAHMAEQLRAKTDDLEKCRQKVIEQESKIDQIRRNYAERVAAVSRAEKMAAELSIKLDKVREYVGEKVFKEALEKSE